MLETLLKFGNFKHLFFVVSLSSSAYNENDRIISC